jgi:hypothetical protein
MYIFTHFNDYPLQFVKQPIPSLDMRSFTSIFDAVNEALHAAAGLESTE